MRTGRHSIADACPVSLCHIIVWTVIYSLPDISSSGLIALAKNFVSANACGTLYYIFVYAHFVLLTPFLFKLAKSRYRYLG